MPFVDTQEMLQKAREGRYAVAAFNIENMETAAAVVGAAAEMKAPVIVQTTPGTVKYGGAGVLAAIVRQLAKEAPVPVALHLDHGSSLALVQQALRAGYSSVMMDASSKPLQENIETTCRAVELAHWAGVPIEAELGKVGGKEDGMEASAAYTEVAEATEFAQRTGVDFLAVAIGTAHGVYKAQPRLDFERLDALHKALAVPLVLHGASGVPDEAVQRAIGLGICKVNIATELRIPFTKAVRDALAQDTEGFDPKSYLAKAREAVADVVRHKITLCGCAGKA